MAEGQKPRKHSEESVKLFVGQVPKHMTEAQLMTLFKEFALVDEVNIIKDKTTRASRGCCFVICPSRQEADKAVNAYHNKKALPGDKDGAGMGGSKEKGIRGESVRGSSGDGHGKKKIEKGCNSSSKKGKEKRETRGEGSVLGQARKKKS